MGARRFRRVDGIVRRDVGGELLLFDPRDDSLHVLNPTGAFLWEQLDAVRSTDDLATSLREAFDVALGHDLTPEVERMLTDLSGRGLLTEEPA